ncbi:MAG: PQQ-binding-like beta-propeller repeat protein [Chloroflexota bacterium]|nr:PQQ-binding-like beta-propeller repeat protein [Chloroflexota bacterium]MDE3193897.1 PQQ-binding-like beta-propeller repeat protein [Chloroflexota bacterium]
MSPRSTASYAVALSLALSCSVPESPRPPAAATVTATASASPGETPTPSPAPAIAAVPGADAARRSPGAGVPFVGHLLIADRRNGRIVEIDAAGNETWVFPKKGDSLPPHYGPWDDAFYTPDRSEIIANAEDDQVVIAIDVATAQLRWHAGVPGVRERGAAGFNTPDDAVPALDGTIHVADIRNCRIVHLGAAGAYLGAVGDGVCRHDPPRSFASPNGAFPTADGGLVVTEINGSWVDWLRPDGTLDAAVHTPAAYPSDAMAYPDGSVLLTDYSKPGQVIRMTREGKVVWRYRPSGAAALDHPSIALPLAEDRVAVCDDYGGRVLIVDPNTDEVVREYTSVGGVHLDLPDGLSYRPD